MKSSRRRPETGSAAATKNGGLLERFEVVFFAVNERASRAAPRPVKVVADNPAKKREDTSKMAEAGKSTKQEGRYKADITAGALKLAESRRIADLLLRGVDADGWNDAIVDRNVLQIRSPATAKRMASFIRARLETMGPDLWTLVRDGQGSVAAHAMFAAAVKHSPLLGDFVGLVVGEQFRLFGAALSHKMFDDYLEGCRERDHDMPQWNEATRKRLRSSVFQILAQAGFVENTASLKLQPVHIADQVLRCLKANHEDYVLRCIQVSP